MMAPEADQVKISICPGVSMRKYLIFSYQYVFSQFDQIMGLLDCVHLFLHVTQDLVELCSEQI
jgi:hypothetical protein